ncbi:MAG: hypothetical protein GJ679_06165 [Rhodobacteraceae bacterium]|nr:hypothetical protein [Paracoccaceae bacterium]
MDLENTDTKSGLAFGNMLQTVGVAIRAVLLQLHWFDWGGAILCYVNNPITFMELNDEA